MGKPSSTSLTKHSECSIHSNTNKQKGKVTMSAHKMELIKKKNHNHVRKNIRKLFNKLKQDSDSSRDTSSNQTQSSLKSGPCNLTIVVPNDSFTPQHKRKSNETITNIPEKQRRKSDSLIIVNDDEQTANDSCIIVSPLRNNSHINCSTPIAHRNSTSIKNLIIDNFPKSNNNDVSQNNTNSNQTKEINAGSYLTIDLTAEDKSIENKTDTMNTVIDLENSADSTNDAQDCTFVSISNASLSMSGDSDVTVVQNKKAKARNKQLKYLAKRDFSNLNSEEKRNLVELVAERIFNGCEINKQMNKLNFTTNLRTNRATETEEDTYIKEVILGESKSQNAEISNSRNSVGSNIYNPSTDHKNKTGLRMIVIDGSNVAMEHTRGRAFSVQGLKICIDYFLKRGHVVKAFVPRFRCKYGKSTDPVLLDSLERKGLVVYTPSREIQGKNCVPYDDRYIVQCAAEFDGVIVSGDNYRDLINENKRWRYIIENRILPFTWVNNMIMFPKDPFGRGGPTLETLLKHPEPTVNRIENKNN